MFKGILGFGLVVVSCVLSSQSHATSRSPETYCQNEDGTTVISIFNDYADQNRRIIIKQNKITQFEGNAELAHHRYGISYSNNDLTLTLGGEPTASGYEGFLSMDSLDELKLICRSTLAPKE